MQIAGFLSIGYAYCVMCCDPGCIDVRAINYFKAEFQECHTAFSLLYRASSYQSLYLLYIYYSGSVPRTSRKGLMD